jgi:hypothetical protein
MRALACAVLVGGLLVAAPSAGAALSTTGAGTIDFATMVSDAEYIGGGIPRYYYEPGNAVVTVSGSLSYLSVGLGGGSPGASFDMDFAAPPGEQLHVGSYEDAQRAPFREPGRPGIDISGDGRGCNTITGRFDVRELETGPGGAIKKMWIAYEQHCEGGLRALSGEVRIGAPVAAGGSLLVAGDDLLFPGTDLKDTSAVAPVPVVNLGASAFTVSSVGVDGVAPDDFEIRSDGCTGVSVAPGDECIVFMRFAPTVGGPRTALLHVDTTAGSDVAVLDGGGRGGLTQLQMRSDPGDYIGQGLTYKYTPRNAELAVFGSLAGIHGSLTSGDEWWYLDFVPGSGDIIAPGEYPDARRYPFQGNNPGMDVSGNGRGCNELSGSFTVRSVSFSPHGDLEHLDLSFEQHCENVAPALRGTLSYRVPVGDTTPPSPVTALRGSARHTTIKLRWTNPTDADLAFLVARFLPGTVAPASPLAGQPGWAGTGTGASITGITPGSPYVVAVFAVDTAGNVSTAATVQVGT